MLFFHQIIDLSLSFSPFILHERSFPVQQKAGEIISPALHISHIQMAKSELIGCCVDHLGIQQFFCAAKNAP